MQHGLIAVMMTLRTLFCNVTLAVIGPIRNFLCKMPFEIILSRSQRDQLIFINCDSK